MFGQDYKLPVVMQKEIFRVHDFLETELERIVVGGEGAEIVLGDSDAVVIGPFDVGGKDAGGERRIGVREKIDGEYPVGRGYRFAV